MAECLQQVLEELEEMINDRAGEAEILGFQKVMSAISEVTQVELRGRSNRDD
jgi:hypothetical protein